MTSGPGPRGRAPILVVAAGAFLFFPGPLTGQAPPDTVAAPDTTAQAADTVEAVPDSLVYHTLPRLAGGPPASPATGVWAWDREALLSTRALTLLELLARVPGMLPLRGGDYGTPEGVTAFGLGGGRIRVFQDGFELLPLDGAVVDLARVGLGGVQHVRLVRGPTEVRIELESLGAVDPRPLSRVEAGTGDLDTNLFRGTFVHPRGLGGSLGVALERVDTRGRDAAETGSRSGGWLRYTYHFDDRGGIQLDYRRHTSESSADAFPSSVTRSDWMIRARRALGAGVVAEVFTGVSAADGEAEEEELPPLAGSRRQHGARAAWEGDGLWATASARQLGGPDLPSTVLDVEGGGALAGVGGASVRWSHERWAGEGLGLVGARAWTELWPVLPDLGSWRVGLAGFGSFETGRRGARVLPAEPVSEDTGEPGTGAGGAAFDAFEVSDRTGLRLGGRLRVGPIDLTAAWLRQETDALLPLGIRTDRGATALPGATFTGYEASGTARLPVDGFSLYASAQRWDAEARYLPARLYQAGLDFHDVFLESGNLEVWGNVGVDGRDPMLVPVPEDSEEPSAEGVARVPFFQTWNAFLQIRVVTVRAFIRFENFTVREELRDYPGRLLPRVRATYGVRWTLWN